MALHVKRRRTLSYAKTISDQEIIDIVASILRIECREEDKCSPSDERTINIGLARLESGGLLGTFFPVKYLLEGKLGRLTSDNPASIARFRAASRRRYRCDGPESPRD